MEPLKVFLTSLSTAIVVVAIGLWIYGSLPSDLGTLVEPPAIPTAPPQTPLSKAGAIFIDSPEIYTRERLVNDRYQQDAWLRRRLEQTDSLEFGVQGVRDVRAATEVIAQARLGVALKPPLGDKAADQPNLTLPTVEDRSADQDRSAATQQGPNTEEPRTAGDRSPIDDFRDRVAYREEVRSAIIENQLDDRHDLDGNTLYRLKFDATVIPTANNHYWGKVEVKVTPKLNRLAISHYSRSWSMEARARHLQQEWIETNPSEVALWLQVFSKYLDGRTQTISSQFATRIAALRRIIELEESHENAAIQTKQDLRELLFRIDRVVREEIDRFYYVSSEDPSSNLKNECKRQRALGNQAPLGTSSINRGRITYASCLIQGTADLMGRQQYSGLWSRAQMVDLIIAAALWQNFRGVTSETRRKAVSRESAQAAQIEALHLSNDWQPLVRATPHEKWINLFDSYDLTEEEAAQLKIIEDREYRSLICREDNPETFRSIEERLENITLGIGHSTLVNSPIFRLDSPSIVTDPESGQLSCFESQLFLVRSDGFIAFLESFMDDPGQPAYSYAITPKEAVQRLSDNFDRAQATSALAAISIAATAVDAEASALALKDLQSDFSGIGRYPLVVGYSKPEPSSDPPTLGRELVFGWVLAPRFHPGQDGSAPSFRQVLTQQPLSALVSVPAWWPALNLDITTSWMDMESGESIENQNQPYLDVRLPGDLHEIQRILSPVLDKAPKIDRDNMEETVFRGGEDSADTKSADNQSVSVLIPGRNLWRSTVVTLGAERAREIWVMPNMGGIVARFDRVPALHSDKAEYAKLRVWTSEGMDIVRNKVCIVPPNDTSGQGCRTRIAVTGGSEALPPTEVAETGGLADRQQVAARTDDPDITAAVEATLSGSPPTPGTEQSDWPQTTTSGMGSAEIVAENLVKTLDEQAGAAKNLLTEMARGGNVDLATTKQSVVDLRQTAQELAALEQANQIVQRVMESAIATEQALQNAIEDNGANSEELKREASNLAAQLQVFDLETRRADLDRAVADVFLNADSGIGGAAIQKDGHVPFKLQISGLSKLTDQDLELRVGLIPEDTDEFISLAFFAPIEAWESKVVDGMLEVEADVPSSDATANGSIVGVALQVTDPAGSYASELILSEPLVFYADEERATIRAVGTDIRLDPEFLDGIFSVTLPAWIGEAFPAGEESTIIAKASVKLGNEKIELLPELYPLNDFDEDDTKRSQELTLSMVMDFYGTDRQLLQDLFDELGSIPVELVYDGRQSGDLPKIRNNLSIKGFAEERPLKK